ncbi:MAG: NAD-dependent deacylase [Methyloligellaceae bacterium]
MVQYNNIVILTGAGLSAESGVSTFRDRDGVWNQYNWQDVATPEGFARNPELVYQFYNTRRKGHAQVKPNAAHFALARLESEYGGHVTIITQNVDVLQEQAGVKNLLHMHGELMSALCSLCESRYPCDEDLSAELVCKSCGKPGGMRPDVVWFNEVPYHMEDIYLHLAACDLFISIGTSGTVYPAAGFVAEAREHGAHTVELNLEPSDGITMFHEGIHGKATEVVPAYVEKLLSGK